MREQPWDAANLPDPPLPLDRTLEGLLDLDWIELTPSSAHVRFDTRDELKQSFGLLHGGVYCAVAETVASVATAQQVWRDGFAASGMSNSANFLRPISGGVVDVVARLRYRGDREWFWDHEFRDEQARLCAIVEVTIAVRPARAP
jgi:1,4-dihydroxy-2-naphthoyl-CoA hydrolase